MAKTTFKTRFDKFKKKSDELYWHFKDMRSKLKALAKEASKLADESSIMDDCEPELFTLLADYETFVGESVDDIYATLSNMKNSTSKKPLPYEKRKEFCFERVKSSEAKKYPSIAPGD